MITNIKQIIIAFSPDLLIMLAIFIPTPRHSNIGAVQPNFFPRINESTLCFYLKQNKLVVKILDISKKILPMIEITQKIIPNPLIIIKIFFPV